jgi:UDP-N-acetylglucosamine 2-epimerase (non-hydrolysing)
MLSDVFFEELEIRPPDYNLGIGAMGKKHYQQTSEVSVKLIELLRNENIKPDIILFLGDSNSVTSALALKKEGYVLGHIEAGMRSFAKYMPEEINRLVCDICCDYHFVYHANYRDHLLKENFNASNIYVVGNTIVEPCMAICSSLGKVPKTNDFIIMDIHRHNNIIDENRLRNVFMYANICIDRYKLPVKFLMFNRTMEAIKNFGIDMGQIECVPLMSYIQYIKAQYHAKFIISDSGSCPEEASILKTPVIIPRNENERWEAMWYNCGILLDVDNNSNFEESFEWLDSGPDMDDSWLGDGNTSQRIVDILRNDIFGLDNEVWKDVVGYEGMYEVSNMGRVRSKNRIDSAGCYRRGDLMNVNKSSNRYAHIYLSKSGVRTDNTVHRLVAEAFVPNIHDKPFVNHKDGNGLNNDAKNLEWVTASENTKHAYEIGLISHKGEKHNLAKLSTADVLEIRRLYEEEGLKLSQIASLYDICFQHVGAIINRQKWGSL